MANRQYKYGQLILPLTVLRRMNPTQASIDRKSNKPDHEIQETRKEVIG